jgi:hypothetical protein
MDEIFRELSQIETTEYELHKIEALNETLSQFTDEVKKHNQTHLEHITNIFNNKLKSNSNFQEVVNNYVNKYVREDLQEDAKQELFLILTGELLGIFKGLTNSKCSIM